MNKVEELKFDSTLWATPAKLVNLLDFKPEKLSIKTENNKLIKTITHQIRYENGGFYLTIDNLKGYFGFIDNSTSNVVLNMIFANDDQKNKYHQVWKEIFKISKYLYFVVDYLHGKIEKINGSKDRYLVIEDSIMNEKSLYFFHYLWNTIINKIKYSRRDDIMFDDNEVIIKDWNKIRFSSDLFIPHDVFINLYSLVVVINYVIEKKL